MSEQPTYTGELLEVLANLEHEQWIAWTAYMLDALLPLYDGMNKFYTAEEERLARLRLIGWRRQIATPYAELSESEKDSDREWAYKALNIVVGPLDPTHDPAMRRAAGLEP